MKVSEWKDKDFSGGKRANLTESEWLSDWFVGWGKDQSCQFEGTWWDMISFARNILASENTKMVAPDFYKPEWKINNYLGEEKPYKFEK